MLDFITYYNGGNFGTSALRTGQSTSGGIGSQGEAIQMKSFRSSGKRKRDLGYGGGSSRGRERGRDGEGIVSDGDSQEMIIGRTSAFK